MSTYILGLSALYHDSAAALIRDGEIIAAAQEERFTRRKHDPRFPSHAIAYCLREAGITAADLHSVVFYEKPYVKFDRLLETYFRVAPSGYETFKKAVPLWAKQKLKLPELIREEMGKDFGGELFFVDHHEAHAASAFYPSPYQEAAILTLDAVGEWSSSSMGTGRGHTMELTHDVRFPHSLGMLYSAFTYYTGFKVNSGEYKLMGLAPYGSPIYADQIKSTCVSVNEDGSIWLDMSYFGFQHGNTMTSHKFDVEFGGPAREPESPITQKEMDLAASIQAVCEEAVLKAGAHVHQVTGMKHLVMAGGVALNCVANGRLLREGPFESIWVQPAAGDAGGALGGALLAWHQQLGNPRTATGKDTQKGSLLGPRFQNDDIQLYLDAVGARYERIDDETGLIDRVSDILAEEKVIGMFQGRMEYGPRALGSRSIIGDPRSQNMQQVMNLKIKFRESFRPFAPCVLREKAHEVFEMRPEDESPYMLMVAPVRDSWRRELSEEEQQRMEHEDLRVRVNVPRSRLPAITHVDYSARVQTVDRERHGRYAEIMWKFYEKTDCPVIVNTSFNIRGEPIVCTPEDAFRCFMATDMDCLVVENFVLMKDQQSDSLLEDAEAYRAQYALD